MVYNLGWFGIHNKIESTKLLDKKKKKNSAVGKFNKKKEMFTKLKIFSGVSGVSGGLVGEEEKLEEILDGKLGLKEDFSCI